MISRVPRVERQGGELVMSSFEFWSRPWQAGGRGTLHLKRIGRRISMSNTGSEPRPHARESSVGAHGVRPGGPLTRVHGLVHRGSAWWRDIAGGPVRAKVVFLLACVLGLSQADLGTLGAIAGKLEHALSLTDAQFGLLAATPAVCAAFATVPMGVLVDRTARVRLLWITMLVWSAAQAISGISTSFAMLLITRVGVGAATAAAIPAVASLVGDLFPTSERGRIWGLILSGELLGSAFGYIIAGEAAAFGPGSWRYAFFVLAIPSILLALVIRRSFPEPLRGGRGQLELGATQFTQPDAPGITPALDEDQLKQSEAQERVAQDHVPPDPGLVLRSDPGQMSIWSTACYVLRIRTNVILIVASALGYFYFTGVVTFGLVLFEDRYHVAASAATALITAVGLAGLGGVIAGGRLADNQMRRGDLNSRINVGAWSFLLSAVLFCAGLLSDTIFISLPLFMLAGVAFGARNPPLDAARLDIMHHRLWGRAEAVRTLLRQLTTAGAPILFGLVADAFAPPGAAAHSNGTHGFGANANGHGLELAFLFFLITVVLGGLLTFAAKRTYPRDVATALASEAAS